MNIEDIDLEEMFENETGKEWHRTYPHIYTKWLEDKLTEQLVKNCSTDKKNQSCLIFGKKFKIVPFISLILLYL